MPPSDDIVRIYLVTGDDHLDDPAWGIDPVFTGDRTQAVAWLEAQPDLGCYSIMRDLEFTWAADLMAEQPATFRSE